MVRVIHTRSKIQDPHEEDRKLFAQARREAMIEKYEQEFYAAELAERFKRTGMCDRWGKNPWKKSHNVETGEWIFECGYNTRTTGTLAYDFVKDVVPYCMESVEHYETWCEPIDDDPWPTDTLLESFIDGEWVMIGGVTEDESLIVLRLIEKGQYQWGEEIPFTPHSAAEIARENRRRIAEIRSANKEE